MADLGVGMLAEGAARRLARATPLDPPVPESPLAPKDRCSVPHKLIHTSSGDDFDS